jgi:hypothetical protein
LWCLDYKSLVASPLVICNLGTTRVENLPHLCSGAYKLQIIRGFATHDLQFGHHACVKTITHFSATWI